MTTKFEGGPEPTASAFPAYDKEHALARRPLRPDAAEPSVFVKVTARREHVDALADMLRARKARLRDIELQGHRAILRARIPLAGLAGCQEAVSSLTIQSAQVFAWPLRDDTALGAAAGTPDIAQIEGILFKPEATGDYVT